MAAVEAEVWRRLGDAEQDIAVAMSKIDGHEKICAERYTGIAIAHEKLEKSIGSMQAWLLRIGVLLLAGMAGILVKIVFFSAAP